MKIKFLYQLSALFLLVIVQQAKAQFVQDINGHPMQTKSYEGVQGSPYLSDQWAMGVVKMTDGRTYKDVPLKYDEVQDELYFQDKKAQTLAFVDHVNEFKINYVANNKPYEKVFRNGFKNIPGSSEASFFEVLSDGTAQLLKKTTKVQAETREYNAPVVKNFEENAKYYLIVSGKVIPFKKDKKFILENLPNKRTELEAYIKTNNINLKDDADLAKLISYYNSM